MSFTTDRDLARHPVHDIKPLSAYVGPWHKARVTLTGYKLEARLALKAMKVRGTPRKFLILARPRSGTTLLARLLNQVDDLICEGEMLHYAVAAPRLFLNNAARSSDSKVYGCKLLTYQMLEVHRLRPIRFLDALVKDGFQFIHVRRNTFAQCLSLSTASMTRQYHAPKKGKDRIKEITLDPDRFVHMVRWNLATLDFEKQMLSNYPHLVVDYDRDLSSDDAQQPTIDRVCSFLDHPSGPVSADLKRVGARNVVVNRDELIERLRREKLEGVLP